MGLKDAFLSAAQTAFGIAGDMTTAVTIKALMASTYSPSTGTVVDTETSESVNALLSGYESNEVDGHAIRATDQRALFPCADITNAPKAGYMANIGGTEWEIITVQNKDGCSILYELQLRRP